MGRTYEAISKAEETLHQNNSYNVTISFDNIPDLKKTEYIGNLRHKIEIMQQNDRFKVFHFVSSREGEGVSTIVANLAMFMAKENPSKNILLIDANAQRPVLHKIFKNFHTKGISDIVSSEALCAECIHRLDAYGIDLVPYGSSTSAVPQQTVQEKFGELISSVRPQYDYILIDSLPLLNSSDSLSLAIASDATFLIVRANDTHWEVAQKAKNSLVTNKCRIAGVVLNRVLHVIPPWLYNRL